MFSFSSDFKVHILSIFTEARPDLSLTDFFFFFFNEKAYFVSKGNIDISPYNLPLYSKSHIYTHQISW